MKTRVLIQIIGLALVVQLASGCASGNRKRNPQEYSSEARALLQEAGEIFLVVGVGSHIVDTTPELHELQEHKLQMRRQKVKEALGKLYDAYSLEPRWERITFAIANGELALGNTDKALRFARETLRLDPKFAWAYTTIAAVKTIDGINAADRSERNSCYSAAIDAYRKFLNIRPEDVRLEPFTITINELKEEMKKP